MWVRLSSNLHFLYGGIMILLIIGLIFLIISIFFFYKTNQIKIQKNKQQQTYLNNLKKQVQTLQVDRNNLINSQIQKRQELHNEYIEYEQNLKKNFDWKKLKGQQEIQDYLNKQQENINLKIQQAKKESYKEIESIHLDTQKIRESAIKEKEQIQQQLDNLKNSLNAGIEACIREKQRKEQTNFYKLQISETDLSDVKMLQDLKISFHKPVVLSKIIWSQYFQKQMTALCDRVLGKKVICGIYKITNLLTSECYIGQSVNVSDRWKQHCKCGLGIQAPSTNILYNAMQKDKVWNFTFELLEECSRDKLNEKEAFWIDMYQSNKFGYNMQKGNKI